ncbi:MAG TPA: DEAD/DEAH box helicase [Rhabdochlamydiaceae bacterium]|nr:DEAD/DEAH box helicase [Rhabdochlamydiaceae bacterium]
MIKYKIDQEKKGGQLFLIIQIQYPRLLYRDTWLKLAKEDELSAVRFLIDQQLRHLGINPLSSAAETVSFNRIYVTAENAFKALELLSCRPEKSNAEFYYKVDGERLTGKLRFEGKEVALSECAFLFPLPSPWFLYEKKLFKIAADWKWIKITKLTPDLQEDPEAPRIIYKQPPKEVQVYPCLKLKDRTGAFADLWLDYGDVQIAFHDTASQPWRAKEKEKYWEKDLLETDFQKKTVGDSHYYCPIDKVVPNLRFLIEMGWKVLDFSGRKVLIHSTPEFTLSAEDDHLKLEGTIQFEEQQLNIKSIVSPLKRQNCFLELSSSTVALIDTAQFPKGIVELIEEEKVHKRNFGLFEPLLDLKNVKKERAILDLFQRQQLLPPDKSFQGTLYPYQQQGLDWLQFLYTYGFHGLLADEMGLGKTVQMLAFFSLLRTQKPILIIVPTTLVFNWKREIEKFLPSFSIYEHQGKERLKREEELAKQKIIITSYALLRIDLSLLKHLDYECIVLDEAQNIKNPKSQAAQAAFQLQGKFRLAITGTPIENRTEDLLSLFQFLMPELLEEEMGDFHRKAKPFILRRTKELIGDQLPEKIEQTIWVEMEEEQKRFYDQFLQNRRLYKKQMEILETLLRLRQICCHPALVDPSFSDQSGKFERFFQDLEMALSEKRKILVYSQFTQMLKHIRVELDLRQIPYAYLDGETKDREKTVAEFQENPDLLLFLISLKAGGVGLNLTQADYVFIYDPWWNEAAERQAIDRAHRIGRKGVLIARRYVTAGTIEEKIMDLKHSKSELLDKLFDSENLEQSLNIEELYNLLSH